MLDADTFDALDYVARSIRGVQAPFGGIRLVLSGDFFQVCVHKVLEELHKYYGACSRAQFFEQSGMHEPTREVVGHALISWMENRRVLSVSKSMPWFVCVDRGVMFLLGIDSKRWHWSFPIVVVG